MPEQRRRLRANEYLPSPQTPPQDPSTCKRPTYLPLSLFPNPPTPQPPPSNCKRRCGSTARCGTATSCASTTSLRTPPEPTSSSSCAPTTYGRAWICYCFFGTHVVKQRAAPPPFFFKTPYITNPPPHPYLSIPPVHVGHAAQAAAPDGGGGAVLSTPAPRRPRAPPRTGGHPPVSQSVGRDGGLSVLVRAPVSGVGGGLSVSAVMRYGGSSTGQSVGIFFGGVCLSLCVVLYGCNGQDHPLVGPWGVSRAYLSVLCCVGMHVCMHL